MIIAPLQKRLLAGMMDFAVFMSLFIIIYLAFSFQHQTISGQYGSGYIYGLVVPTSAVYPTVLLSWTVFIILTEFRGGQSIGKCIVKIKAVRQDLKNTTFLTIFIRHLFDIVDLTLLTGLVVAFTNKDRQRVGDLVAKTIVVTK